MSAEAVATIETVKPLEGEVIKEKEISKENVFTSDLNQIEADKKGLETNPAGQEVDIDSNNSKSPTIIDEGGPSISISLHHEIKDVNKLVDKIKENKAELSPVQPPHSPRTHNIVVDSVVESKNSETTAATVVINNDGEVPVRRASKGPEERKVPARRGSKLGNDAGETTPRVGTHAVRRGSKPALDMGESTPRASTPKGTPRRGSKTDVPTHKSSSLLIPGADVPRRISTLELGLEGVATKGIVLTKGVTSPNLESYRHYGEESKSESSSSTPYLTPGTARRRSSLAVGDSDQMAAMAAAAAANGGGKRRGSIHTAIDPYKEFKTANTQFEMSPEEKERELQALKDMVHEGASGRTLSAKTALDPYRDLKTSNTQIILSPEEKEKEEKALYELTHSGAGARTLKVKTSLDPLRDMKTANALTPELEAKLYTPEELAARKVKKEGLPNVFGERRGSVNAGRRNSAVDRRRSAGLVLDGSTTSNIPEPDAAGKSLAEAAAEAMREYEKEQAALLDSGSGITTTTIN